MKHSISKKFATIFILIMFGTILLCYFLNSFFLVKYYRFNKGKAIIDTYHVIEEIYSKGELKEEEGINKIYYSAELNNTTLFIGDYTNRQYFCTSNDPAFMEKRMNDYVLGYRLSEEDESYKPLTIHEIVDQRNGSVYLELWGELDEEDGVYFLARTSVESMNESVKVSNRFFLYVGLLATFVSAVIMLVVTKRMTRPIENLTEISKRMAELDFTARYDSNGQNDEIDRLGKHMNTLSGNLESAITELKNANNELQQDIEKREQIDEMRKEFISNVSHELKTPIAIIQGYAEGLKDCVNDDPESRDFYCDVIMDEAAKMNEIVKKLLTLNHIEFGNDALSFEWFDMVQSVKELLKSSDILIKQKDVTLKFGDYEPVYVWADRFMAEEVLRNYFSNALNHVENERIIEIRVMKGSNQKVRISVFNTGSTIPEESIDRIWEKFYKVDKARTRGYGGSGVGLSIVKAIMTKMNESYGVKNYDNGVEFWFELDADRHMTVES